MGRSTDKPRINLVVDPEIYETVTEMAAMQGKSRAGLLMDLIRSVHPTLRRTLTVMKAAEQYKGQAPDELRRLVESGCTDIRQASTDQLDILDNLQSALETDAAGPEKREAHTAPARGRS